MHIENVTINVSTSNSTMSRAFIEALLRGPELSDPSESPESTNPNAIVVSVVQPPRIGDAWPEQDGIYAGVSRGEDGDLDAHIVLLDAVPEKDMDWPDAVKWADGLGNGARLPTRFESALLYANLRDKLDTNCWHWTGTQYSADSAFVQYFYNGSQFNYIKKFQARARAVRRFIL